MSQQMKVKGGREERGMSDIDRLRLRVSAMVNSPRAASLRQATIWRLESDTDQAWTQVIGELQETDGLEMIENEDGTITLYWEAMVEEGPEIEADDMDVLPGMVVQHLHEEPAPF
ncbi:DUF1654 domain-containing protein [Pseudomonas aeruginosa]|uniref:DUF1654 domain-containing protein n=1 Tax=Pseudomonas aeruginosa TaxID=287 RepID=UPI000A107A07|nr:DUF1654 domain-containing protein [Pseudomonas aeruginosa]MCV3838367.1 DUF1654 domain-containing protein [Pseudomonas aeruginosa]MDO1430862.1 DUF1654 domain-containing protein [Pseudomonas aeruginosa]ORL55474.1 hypothetical protein B7H20_25550 [Pseudomonas aeruginosa]RRI34276.1 DUF1654 domain-containing protein [Pseudomonas aeruginosa]WCU66610.1 DUF1654 domain-containing protein [Pseudomonas aeruginosa]